jgi:hypothetical protein
MLYTFFRYLINVSISQLITVIWHIKITDLGTLMSSTRTCDDRRCEDAVWKVAVDKNPEGSNKEEK